ncbi:MAG: RdgB/HAM1 family non-canonical purine NTP pyrophosphatase [Oscillospiraceae bacterium]|nr:RdgB/HAM1 family non-canonical purine NTP pyrophosphatase [Oscillospiraceae bacterium]
MKFVLATNNKGKLREIRELFADMGIEFITQREAGLETEAEENGSTFEENAMIKAKHACDALGLPAIADDSGICIDALDGGPGIYSARFGNLKVDALKNQYVLDLMKDTDLRGAHYVCAIVCLMPNGDMIETRGECWGEILREPRGEGGFGYDPIFLVPELGKSMAELTMEEKNAVSHRGRALREFKAKLNKYLEENKYADR